ncbi:transposase [Ekhidna sp.]
MEQDITGMVGAVVLYNDEKYIINDIKVDDVELVNDFGEVISIDIKELEGKIKSGINSITSFRTKDIELAKQRLKIIEPLLSESSRTHVEEIAKAENKSAATLYRWIKNYRETGLLTSLIPEQRTGGKGKSRLDSEIDLIIDKNIEKHYLQSQRKSIKNVHIHIQLECREKNIEAPHYNTLRRRIASLSEYNITKHRFGKARARKEFDAKIKKFPDALFPLSSVQIDHTPLDIIVVDEKHREPLGRPWLTLAIDSYSRMVVGFYIGFENPNSMSVGLCISQAILSKEQYLARMEIKGDWPCYGRIKCIHVDNAMEFRSRMLEDACVEYQMDINWRPVKKPEFGGYIERLLGTFMSELHNLPGTTFRALSERGEYDSEKMAVFTFDEMEKWLAYYIVNVYHKRKHSGLGTSPIKKWNDGIFGSDDFPGVGYQPIQVDDRKVHLDFMPFQERTIQDYGVLIDGIYYYSDILRKWINSIDVKSGKLRAKRKFKFKRDPRDISVVYFLDPELKEYFPINYRDLSNPAITIWELRKIRSILQERGDRDIDESAIFDAYRVLQDMEERAKSETKKMRRLKVVKEKQKSLKQTVSQMKEDSIQDEGLSEDIFNDLGAFEDIDDGSSE